MRSVALGLLTAVVLSGAALAQDPVTGAVQNFFTVSPGGSQTAPPAAFGGERCNDIVPKVGAQNVWWGRFAGGRIISGAGRHDRMQNFSADGCFPSQAACEGWMYQLKSRYGDNPRFNDCRAGYQPGAPVRWVFGPNMQPN